MDSTVAELDNKKRSNGAGHHEGEHDLESLIRDGCGADFGGDRSRAVWFVIHQLLKQGKSAEDIGAVLLNRENGISDHVFDQTNPEDFVRRQVEKARTAAKTSDSTLPTIQVFEGQVARAVDETEAILLAAGKPVYQRGHMLVTPRRSRKPTA